MADTSEESKIDETETITTLTQVKDNMPLDKQTDWKRNTRKNGTRVFIGRRTGKTIKVNKSFNINDCFPQVEESDEENVSPKEIPKPAEKPAKAKAQANKAAKRHFIGRRTGKSISVKQPSNIQDFLSNIDNLFPQNSDDSIVKSINRSDKTINQTINRTIDQTIDQSINQSQVEEEKEETNQQEKESDNNVIATLDENQPAHSPNLTGTAVKNTAELDESAVKFYGSKKRLFPSCEESIASQATDASRVESNVQTEEDLDVTGFDIDVENCSNATMSKSLLSAKSNTKKSHDMVKNTENEEKDIQKVSNTSVRNSKHKKQSIKSSIKKSKRSVCEEEDSEDEEIDVENCSSIVVNKSRNKSKTTEKPDDDLEDIENDESTFVTLGKKTKSTSRISEIDVTGVSFEIDESVILEGTKHKEMSPEFGESSHQSKTKQTSKETQRRRKTADKTHTENTLKDGSIEERGDKTLIDSTNEQSFHDVFKSRRSTRRSAKQSSQTEQDSEENITKGKATRMSTRGKKADLTADHVDSHQAIPKKVSRKSILKRATSNTSTLVSSETDAQSSDQNEESSAISRKQKSNRKSIRFSKAIDTDKSEASVQDAEDLNEDLEQSLNTSKKTRQSVRGKGKAKNTKTLDESHDDHTLDISKKALTSTRNNIEIPDQTSIDCSTISTRSTRSSRKGKDNNTTLDSRRGRRSMKTRQSSLASETVDHERLSENVSKNLTTQSTRSTDDHSSDQVDDDDDDASSSDHVDDACSSDDDGSGSDHVIGDGGTNDEDDSVDNDDDGHDDLDNDVDVAADDVVDDAGVEDPGDHDESKEDDVDDNVIDDDVDNDGINDDDDELSQTKRQTRSIVNSTHHNDTTNSSETSSSKEKKTQRNNKSTLSKKDSKVSNTDGSTDDDKHNSKKQDENVGRKSMHKNLTSDEDKSDNKKDQTARKSRGKPRKSTRSMIDDVPGSNDRTDFTNQSQADLTKDSPADNTKDSQTDDGQTSHIDTTNTTQDSHDLQVSMSNDYEADESQSKTMSNSKRSASESEDDKKNKKKRRKKTSIIPKQLKNTNGKRKGRSKLSNDNTSRNSSGAESNASLDESSKGENVSRRGKRKTQDKSTSQDNSQSKQASAVDDDLPIVMADEDYQEMHDTIQNETIPGNQGEDEKQHESKTTSDDENTHQTDSKKRRGQENNAAETTVNKKSRSRNRSHTNQTAMHSTSDDDSQSDSVVVTRKTRQQEKNNNTRSRKRRNNSESSTGSDNDSQSEQDKPGKTRKNNKKNKSETIMNEQSKASGGSTVDSPATNTPIMTKSPFLHPKGSTLIKSILKSSLPRSVNSNSNNRRVSISSKKHPIKSPENSASKNDQRRSSVSFAPTPSFRVAPDDSTTFEDSPLGYPSMSFLSNSSSYTLGESTFTPGGDLSLSSTISSIGSASKLSPDSTTFNESQEVTISSAKRQQVEEFQEDVIRRSKRTKVPPLEYWKNERINYKRRKSGWYIDGIEHVPTPKVPKRKARKTNKKKVSVAAKTAYDGYGGDEPQTFNGVLPDFNETPCEPVPVVNPYDGQEVKLELLHTPEMLQFVNTSQDPAGPDDPLVIDKYISHNSFGIGQLILRPGAEKGKQHVRKDTMAFHVLTGQVEVNIHETTALLRAGSTFYVPEGNCYNLKNTSDTDTRLFFVQIKSQD